MIAKNIKNAVDIQKNGKRVLNVIKNGEVVYYYIPDSYVELEYIQITSAIKIAINNKANIDYDISIIHDGEDVTYNQVFLTIQGNVRYLFSYCNYASTFFTSNTVPYFGGKLFSSSSDIVKIGVKCNDTSMSLYRNKKLIQTIGNTTILPSNTTATFNYRNDGKTPYKILNFTIKESTSQAIIHNFIPVRRLGDAICGMYDTINQKFYPSETQVQFKGGPIKMIKNEQWSLTAAANSKFILNKKTYIDRQIRSHIASALYSIGNQSSTYLVSKANEYDSRISDYYKVTSLSPYGVNFAHFTRVCANLLKDSDSLIIQNINPNWNILKSDNVSANDYELNNQNLYFANKSSIEVVLTGNKKGNSNNINVTKADIQRIIHLPYLDFTGNETSLINIAPLELTKDTSHELYVSIPSYITSTSYGVIGGPGNTDDRFFYTGGNQSIVRLGEPNVGGNASFVVQESEPLKIVRIDKTFLYINNKKYKHNLPSAVKTYTQFGLGNRMAYKMKGNFYYYRIERKNSLYRHYLPALMLLKDGSYYLGFFETVEQVFYKCDDKTLPATNNGAALSDDWSNIIDINGNVIDYKYNIITPVYTIGGNDNDAVEIRNLYNKYVSGECDVNTIIKVISSSGKYIIGSLSSWREHDSSNTVNFILQFDLSKDYEQDAYTNPTKFTAYLENGSIIFVNDNLE